jgi:hypothetical protein
VEIVRGETPATDRMRSQSPWLKRLTKPPSSGAGWETYAIAIIYVPFLMITLVLAFYLLVRPQPNAVAEPGLLRNEPTEI